VNPEDDKIRKLLHARFDSIAEEPIPARMYLRSPSWIDPARAAVFVAVGIAVGLAIPHLRPEPPKPVAAAVPLAQPLPALAARAHYVYTREKRHAVEVAASDHEHLVTWLSRRLEVPLKVPVLAQEGYELVGGRLLPGTDAPVAQFMYENKAQKRLTLYVVGKQHKQPVTAFRFIQDTLGSLFSDEVGGMKLIIAVIKPSRLDAVLDAVTEAGASGLTVTEVRGYGRQRGKTEVYRGAEYEVKLLPKVKLEIAVPDDIAGAVVEAVKSTANTNKIGDGKIFVLDLERALRIRTGEEDAAAIAG